MEDIYNKLNDLRDSLDSIKKGYESNVPNAPNREKFMRNHPQMNSNYNGYQLPLPEMLLSPKKRFIKTANKFGHDKTTWLSQLTKFPLNLNIGSTLDIRECEMRKYEAFECPITIPESLCIDKISLYTDVSDRWGIAEIDSYMDRDIPVLGYKLSIVFNDVLFREPKKAYLFQKLFEYEEGSNGYRRWENYNFDGTAIILDKEERRIFKNDDFRMYKCLVCGDKPDIKKVSRFKVTKYHWDGCNLHTPLFHDRWNSLSEVEYLNYSYPLYKSDGISLDEILHVEKRITQYKPNWNIKAKAHITAWLGVEIKLRNIYGI